jgi:hypothetical protein
VESGEHSNQTYQYDDAVGIEQGSQPFQRLVFFIHKKSVPSGTQHVILLRT